MNENLLRASTPGTPNLQKTNKISTAFLAFGEANVEKYKPRHPRLDEPFQELSEILLRSSGHQESPQDEIFHPGPCNLSEPGLGISAG